MRKCIAAIDIGSNAVRLLIKKADNITAIQAQELTKALLLRVPLRLGFDVFSMQQVSKTKEEKLTRLMKAFRQLMKIYEVDMYRACATSAMRDARNGKDIIRHIRQKTGIDIEIIDGQEEARMIYSNHAECMEDRTGNYMYVDVGGGSTEINLLSNGRLVRSLSYNIGTVRMLSGHVKESTWRRMTDELTALTAPLGHVNIIGSGGNINKLYKLAAIKDKEHQRLPVSSLQAIYDELSILSTAQRMQMYHLKADRADVIIPAARIFLAIAQVAKADFVHVPVIGLADGIIHSLCTSP